MSTPGFDSRPNELASRLITGSLDGRGEGLLSVLAALCRSGIRGWDMAAAAETAADISGIYANGLDLYPSASANEDWSRLRRLTARLEAAEQWLRHDIEDPDVSWCSRTAMRAGLGTLRDIGNVAGFRVLLLGNEAKTVSAILAAGLVLASRGGTLPREPLRALSDQAEALSILHSHDADRLMEAAAQAVKASGYGRVADIPALETLTALRRLTKPRLLPNAPGEACWPLVHAGTNLRTAKDALRAAEDLRAGILRWAAGTGPFPESPEPAARGVLSITTADTRDDDTGAAADICGVSINDLRDSFDHWLRVDAGTPSTALCECGGGSGDVAVQTASVRIGLTDYLFGQPVRNLLQSTVRPIRIPSGTDIASCTSCGQPINLTVALDWADPHLHVMIREVLPRAVLAAAGSDDARQLLSEAFPPDRPLVRSIRSLRDSL